MQFLRLTSLAVVVLCLIGFGEVRGDQVATFVLKDGARYENVPYSVNYQYYTVKLKLDEGERNISYTNIETVLDAEGNDITGEILNRRISSKPAGGEWRSKDPDEYWELREKPFSVAISVLGAYDVVVGDYYTGIGGGASGGLLFRLAFTDQIAGRIRVERIATDFTSNSDFVPYGGTYLSGDASLRTWTFTIGAEYFQNLNKLGKKPVYGFIQTSLGLVTHSTKGEITFVENSTGDVYLGIADDSETRFVSSFGVGMVPMLSESIGIELSVDLDGVWVEEYYTNGTKGVGIHGAFLELHAGIVMHL